MSAGAVGTSGRTRLVEGFATPAAEGVARSGDGHPGHRPVWAEIDLGAITHNARVLAATASDAQLMAVVKADGYGHGAVAVARAALAGGATWLGVALVEEGEALRAAGIEAPVLVLSEPPPAAAPALLAAGLTPAVYTPAFVAALEAAARDRGGGPVGVHLKVDTGMRRVGVPEPDLEDALRRLRGSDVLAVQAIWSHLAVADDPDQDATTAAQAAAFDRALATARRLGVAWELAHLCNSAGTLRHPDLHHDLVRTGIALYGLEAGPGVGHPDLRAALALRARLGLVKHLAAGEPVSYGHRWSSAVDTIVGSVPAGYADGVRRGLTGRGQALHVPAGGAPRRVPVVGTVCMDQLLVDLGPEGGAPGDDVWLLGGPSPDRVTAEDWAAWLDTITYEVVCGIGARVPRVHLPTP